MIINQGTLVWHHEDATENIEPIKHIGSIDNIKNRHLVEEAHLEKAQLVGGAHLEKAIDSISFYLLHLI
jgi:hypothetical protein